MTGTIPVPVRETVVVPASGSSEVISRDAVLPPADTGLNVTVTVQLDPGPMVGVRLAQGSAPPVSTLNIPESVPVMSIKLTLRERSPVFDIVTSCAVDVVPCSPLPNESEFGVTETLGAPVVTLKASDEVPILSVAVDSALYEAEDVVLTIMLSRLTTVPAVVNHVPLPLISYSPPTMVIAVPVFRPPTVIALEV